MEIDPKAELGSLKKQYHEELNRFWGSFLQNIDLTFDREVMEKMLDLSPPGLDEIMALMQVMDFMAQRSFDLFILDSAPTGHLIRLLELPAIIDQWLKAFFELFLKYKKVFGLPKVTDRLIRMSKDLKMLRTLLLDSKRSALCAVSILTGMAFEETKDLVAACGRMEVSVPVLFLNMATPESGCPLCSALYRREAEVREIFSDTFPGMHQVLVYRQGEPRGPARLEMLGNALYYQERDELSR